MLDEIELYRNLNNNQNLTESDTDKLNAIIQLEQQIQKQEMKGSGWRFDRTNSTIYIFL